MHLREPPVLLTSMPSESSILSYSDAHSANSYRCVSKKTCG